MLPSRDTRFLHVFILQTDPSHYAIFPVCQQAAIQKSTKAAARRENIKLGVLIKVIFNYLRLHLRLHTKKAKYKLRF